MAAALGVDWIVGMDRRLKTTCALLVMMMVSLVQVKTQALPETKGAPPVERQKLPAAELMTSDFQGAGPVHNDYFMPVGESAPALHPLTGKLTVTGMVMQGNVSDSEAGLDLFPGFSVDFFTYADYLVPVERGIIPGLEGNSFWQIILGPGRVWSEPGDGGFSRASFPFTLTSRLTNEAHNGLATFIYNDRQISGLRFQVVQETAVHRQFDFWGQLPMEYHPHPFHNRKSLMAQFADELARQTTILPWSELSKQIDPQLVEAFGSGLAPDEVSATGMIVDGVVYLQPCMTRYGQYPYCRQMRHGAYSLTKSLGALLAMLHLAQKYGDDVFDLYIADYVPVTAVHDGWQDVTFGHVLNMAVGVGDHPHGDLFADENGPTLHEWEDALTVQEKLAVAFSLGNYPWGPGEVVRYNTAHTFILAVAMQNYLESREGPDADLWPMLQDGVFEPMGIYHMPVLRTQETDGKAGLPLLGVGMYITVDDMAKIVTLLQNNGQYEGRPLLSAAKLAEAMYQTPNRGLPIERQGRYGDEAYLMSLWAMPYRDSDGRFYQIPYMAGYGGNFVVLLPNGVTAFRLADAENFEVMPLIRVGEAVRPFPQAASVAVASRIILPEKIQLDPARQLFTGVLDRLLVGLVVVTAVFVSAAIFKKQRNTGRKHE